MAKPGQWQSYTAGNAPEAVTAKMASEASAEPAATIEIQIFDTTPGQSTVSVRVSQAGKFAPFQQASQAGQRNSANELYQVACRELGNGLRALAD
jgi:hypothetical protein